MVRFWDSCSFSPFTRMTSGENPRREKRTRYRQRVYHKFSYFKKTFGEIACVGCGRCVRECPVKVDIAEIVNKAVDEAQGDKGTEEKEGTKAQSSKGTKE